MFICSALLVNDYGEQINYKIVTEKEQENTKCNDPIVYLETPIAKALIEAIVKKEHAFICNKIHWDIIKYSINDEFYKFTPKFNKNKRQNRINEKIEYIKCDDSVKIYVYNIKGVCSHCVKYYGVDDVEDVVARIPVIGDESVVIPVNIHYCHSCNRYFINKYSLRSYEKRYGVLLFYRIVENYTKKYNLKFDSDFADDTILSRYGYTVRQGELTDEQRHTILKYLIDTQKASKHYIIQKLSEFVDIRLRNNSGIYTNAIKLWEDDIAFVNEYKIESQNDCGNGTLVYRK